MKSAAFMVFAVLFTNFAIVAAVVYVLHFLGCTAGEALVIWLCFCGLILLFVFVRSHQIEKQEKLKREREDGFV